MADDELSDDQIHTLLWESLKPLQGVRGRSVLGDTTLRTSRQMLSLLMLGMLKSKEDGKERNVALKDPVQP